MVIAGDEHAPPESEWLNIVASASLEELGRIDQHCASRVDQLLNAKKPGSSLDQSNLDKEITAWAGFWDVVKRERLQREEEDAE